MHAGRIWSHIRSLALRRGALGLAALCALLALTTAQAQPPEPSSKPGTTNSNLLSFYPLSLAVAESGDIFLADRNRPGVWKLQGETLSLYFAGSKQLQTPLNAIRCVAFDRDGKLLAGDSATRDIYRFDDQGQPVGLTREKVASAPPPAAPRTSRPQPVVLGKIGIPVDIAVAANGDIFVSDLEVHRIVRVPREGGDVREFARVQAPRGLCSDGADHLWVISGQRLLKIAPNGQPTTVVDEGTFLFPHTVAVAADQTAYVCDGYAKAIWKIPPGGKPVQLVAGEPFVNPVGMRLAGEKLYVVDPRAQAVFQVALDGRVTRLPFARPE